jgi:isopentenyl-diphosphate delta-isomerase
MEKVVLVDRNDNQIGLMEKMEAHEKALLHRAFSVFIFNSNGEMLLQKRAVTKYHCGGMWANTCCSHPREHESDLDAATRRLKEEMGIETPLSEIFNFIYKAELDKNLTEHEFDHVFVGYYDGEISLNKDEVEDYCFGTIEEINEKIQLNPSHYTPWFLIAFPRVSEWWKSKQL